MEIVKISAILRYKVIEMSHIAKTAHLASALSCIDLLAVLYEKVLRINPEDPKAIDRDRFILSKGHGATALYAVLNYKGIIEDEELSKYGTEGSLLEEHPSPKQQGIEAATGSLGHGLAIANGIALGAKIQGRSYSTYVLMSDGEMNEGSVWEAALFSARHELNNLTAIIDYNKWQATGRSEEVLAINPLCDKWESFGWEVEEIDGHDHEAILTALTSPRSRLPRMIIAHTVKGKGIGFMEDDNNWHYRSPDSSELEKAREELEICGMHLHER
jgi:transketolase